MRPVRAALLLVLVLLPVRAGLADDVIRLKNGNSLPGRIVEEDENQVTIEMAGGRMTIARSEIAEIVRDKGELAGEAKPGTEAAEVLRSEHFFLWSGERRIGHRSLWTKKLADGNLLCEEETVFTTEGEQREVLMRIVEKVTAAFEPLSIEYRERSGRGQITRVARVEGDRLKIETSLPGKKRTASLALPEQIRFPLSAREFAVRERDRLRGAWEIQVFDPREENFFRFIYDRVGKRKTEWKGERIEITVLRRRRGGRAPEEIWLDGAGQTILEELNGPSVVAMRAARARVDAARKNGLVTPNEDEKRIQPVFTDPEKGFTVRKPSIAWTFEKPAGHWPEDRKVLTISSLRFFAYVDVFLKDGEPEGGLLTSLALEMQREFAAESTDFRKLSDGYLEVGGEKAYRMVATSKNKGEELRSWLVGVLHGGQTWLITMACPPAYWDDARPEFLEILDTFQFLGGPEKEKK